MEDGINRASREKIEQLMKDVALIKEILFFNKLIKDPEGELSDWAEEHLRESRNEEGSISHEALKRELGL